ncbi:ABC transporter permease [Mangrovibacter plantisponsor]|uniref:Osmoprotectant transport system permease protein n=1 Tax=Mangrovibacter plantisponsor TaxID=451513 RepID=A0A317QA27_9ENTR|nr:ABC transporter permease [Mangrovibacter plantisponsor]PWW11426.1 osmoprotectant transport system permease protein [Mangrovibacter plantisponsor]
MLTRLWQNVGGSFRQNPVLWVLVALLVVTVLYLPVLTMAPNRLLSGQPVMLSALVPYSTAALLLAAVVLLACSSPRHRLVVVLLFELLFIGWLFACGFWANQLAGSSHPYARVSLAGGTWLVLAISLIGFSEAARSLLMKPAVRAIMYLQLWLVPLALLYSGHFDGLSLLKEYANRKAVFDDALLRHLALTFGTLLPALVIGIPLGLYLHRKPQAQSSVFSVLNVIQTVPSVAMFGLLIAPLSALGNALPWLGTLGIGGIGAAPAIIALVLYALLPLVRGVVAGLDQVPQAVKESAQGNGMTPWQCFVQVEVPLALPVLLRNLRVVTVQTTGMAVVAALIGAGGFGALIFQGLSASAQSLVLLGVIPVVALAVLADRIFHLLIHRLEHNNHD